MPETVGFIGLGQMGDPIARNLLAGGIALKVYNRTAARMRPLIDAGAVGVTSAPEAAEPGGILFSMLSDDAALRDVCSDALLTRLGEGAVHVSMSTVSPQATIDLAKRHRAFGVSLVSAPVMGRPEAAASRMLHVILAGDAASKARIQPLLRLIGQSVNDVSDAPETANIIKLAGNFLAYAAVEAMAEASVLVERHGIPRQVMLDLFTQTLFASPAYQGFSRRIINADFEKAGFTARLALKDMTLANNTADPAPMPMLDLLISRYQSLVDTGQGEVDATAIASVAAKNAGLTW